MELQQVMTTFLAICSGIICISGAIGVLGNLYLKWKAPDKSQDEKIEFLEKEVEKIKRYIGENEAKINDIVTGNQVTQRAILALLSHGIDGNEIEAMRKAKEALQEYLTNK